MSTDTSAEVVVEETVSREDTEMRARIRAQLALSAAIRDYLESLDKFGIASKALNDSSQVLREKIKPNTTVVARMTYGSFYGKHYLLQTDNAGNFDLDPVEVI